MADDTSVVPRFRHLLFRGPVASAPFALWLVVFTPDVIAEVCGELDLPFSLNGYRYWAG